MLLASGALGIVASALYLIAGIICIFGSYEMWIQQQQPVAFSSQYYYQILELAALGILNLVSFGLSLTAGVLTLDRKHVTWLFRILIVAIVGPIIPFGASFTAPQIFFGLNSVVLFFVFFSLPAICLDVVALIFIALRREDFPKF